MRKPLFIGIGVSQPANKDSLPAVPAIMSGFGRWADKAGYETRLFLDVDPATGKPTPVVSTDISKALDAQLLLQRPRVIVYFCGHGDNDQGDHIWHLSDGDSLWSERINVRNFLEVLETCASPQIAIFSDTCRTPAVLLGGGSPVIIPIKGLIPLDQRVDLFLSTRNGVASYAHPKDGPVFSRCVLAALEAPVPLAGAVDKVFRDKGRVVISSHSLRTYLEAAVPTEAGAIGESQWPKITTNFDYFDNAYRDFGAAPGASPLESGNPLGLEAVAKVEAIARSAAEKTRTERAAKWKDSEWRGNFWVRVRAAIPSSVPADLVVESSLEPALLDGQGNRRTLLSATPSVWLGNISATGPAVLAAGQFTIPIMIYPGYSTILQVWPENKIAPVGALAWLPLNSAGSAAADQIDAMALCKGFFQGEMTVEDLAAFGLKMNGEALQSSPGAVNPLLAIVAAHTADQAGDFRFLEALVALLVAKGQPIPVDLAVVAELRLELADAGVLQAITSDGKARPVAGFLPVMKVGWYRLHRSDLQLHMESRSMIPKLGPSPVATLEEDGRSQLISVLNRNVGAPMTISAL